jgi:hypothetical protein
MTFEFSCDPRRCLFGWSWGRQYVALHFLCFCWLWSNF